MNVSEDVDDSDRTHSETDRLLHPGRDEPNPSASSTYAKSQGVSRMEAVQRAAQGREGRGTLYAVGISIVVCAWAFSLDVSTTSHYAVLAASDFNQHSSGLASLAITTNIIAAVSKPFIAKISDITSRPYTYIVVLVFYTLGYTIVATSRSLSTFIFGEVLVSVGSSGLDLLNEIIVGDLTPLQWRGFMGSVLSAPFVINTWFSAKIVSAMSQGDYWRWGYGMFAIIMPIVLGPAIGTLIFLDQRAHKLGIVNMASSNAARRQAQALAEAEGREGPHGDVVAEAVIPTMMWEDACWKKLQEIDALGLLLLGAGWTFLLLPFSMRSHMKGGMQNVYTIFMILLGIVFLAIYVLFERFVAKFPSAPKRLFLNRTLMCAAIIDFVYLFASQMRTLYLESYVLIVKPWSYEQWTYFGNTLLLSLCGVGLIAGLLQRWTHRYRTLQICGLVVMIFGIGVTLEHGSATSSSLRLIMSQILIGSGGAFSVVGSRVAAQASVPHQDMATVIALLSLWSRIGSSVGSAVAALIWTSRMPGNLRQYLPANVSDEKISEFFGNIRLIREYDIDDPIRQGAIIAYQKTLWHLILPSLLLSFIPLTFACFQIDFYLGNNQNAVMNMSTDGNDVQPHPPSARSYKARFWHFWGAILDR